MVYIKHANASIEEIDAKLVRIAAEHKFGVLGVHDLKEKMKSKGIDFGPDCVVFEVCNPSQAKKVLEMDMTLSTVLPCRIAVYQDHGKTAVATLRPTAMISLFPAAEQVMSTAREVEESLMQIIDEVCA